MPEKQATHSRQKVPVFAESHECANLQGSPLVIGMATGASVVIAGAIPVQESSGNRRHWTGGHILGTLRVHNIVA